MWVCCQLDSRFGDGVDDDAGLRATQSSVTSGTSGAWVCATLTSIAGQCCWLPKCSIGLGAPLLPLFGQRAGLVFGGAGF